MVAHVGLFWMAPSAWLAFFKAHALDLTLERGMRVAYLTILLQYALNFGA